jgi:hypothetical protein
MTRVRLYGMGMEVADANRTKDRRLGAIDAAFAALAVLSLVPALCVRYPQSVDYLNHMARLFVLSAPADHPIHLYYAVHWHPVANLGLEIVALPLSSLIGIEAAMKAVWCLCVLGIAGGTWFVHRSLYPRSEPTLLLAAPMLLCLPLTVGLLNFTLGTALALFATGLWIRWSGRLTLRRLILFNLISGLTLIFHIAAGAALALTVGTLHVFRERKRFFPLLLQAASGFVLPLLLAAIVAVSANGGCGTAPRIFYSLAAKIGIPAAPTFVANPVADAIGTSAVWFGLLAAWKTANGRCHRLTAAPILAWTAALLLLPNQIGNSSYIDIRMALIPAILLVASFRCPSHKKGAIAFLCTLAVVATLARVAVLVPAWQAYSADIAAFRAASARLPFGVKVLVVSAPETDDRRCDASHRWAPKDEHIPSLLVIDRNAYVSTIFADPKMQPIEPTPKIRDYARANAGILPWNVLLAGQAAETHPALARKMPPDFWGYYPDGWTKRYDYLAVLKRVCDAVPPREPGLAFAGSSGIWRFYRIVRPQ